MRFESAWNRGQVSLEDKIGSWISSGIVPGSSVVAESKIRLKTEEKYVGKLGLKVEAAGKVRVFAMLDPFSQ
jgi:hypothetical protein